MDIVREADVKPGGVVMADGEPKIRLVPFPRVAELTTVAVRYERTKRGVPYEVEPPRTLVSTVFARGEWAHIRPMAGIVSWPVLRPDGTLFLGPGYDIGTQTYSNAKSDVQIPPCVTPEHVAAAVATFDDIIGEFPYETPAHKSAWIAGLLTVIARRTIAGPVPLLIIDANTPGSGKTALADTLGAALLGTDIPRRAIPKDDEEWRKAMLGIGVAAVPLVLLDNLKGTLRSSVLDAVLTGRRFEDRALGLNIEIKVDVPTLFVVTTNNATLDTDLVRRSIHCRIVAEEERPEARDNFRYRLPDDAYKPEIRRRLLEAATTILVGYHQAERPKQNGRVMGSFDAWTAAVRDPLLWAGFADPIETQDELREQADSDTEILAPLLESWFGKYGEADHDLGTVLGDLLDDRSNSGRALASSVLMLGEKGRMPDARLFGYKLRKWREKRCVGLRFVAGSKGESGRKWGVRKT